MKSNIHQLRYVIAFTLITSLLGATGCKSNNYSSTVKPASAANPSQTPYNARKLTNRSGWRIPGLAQAKEFKLPLPLQVAVSGPAKVSSTWLRPEPGGDNIVTLRDSLTDDQLRELGITAKRLQVITIVKYGLGDGDRPFCYVVKYRSTYSMEGLHYYDEDGDGRFELVETGTPSPEFTPRIPGWAQR